MTVITQIGIMSLLIGLGFLCSKLGIITENSTKCLSDLALKVATPALLIISFQVSVLVCFMRVMRRLFIL